MTTPPDALCWTLPQPPETTAELVDVLRDVIIEAWERGEDPSYLVVDDDMRERLLAVKEREVARGIPLVVLGLVVV